MAQHLDDVKSEPPRDLVGLHRAAGPQRAPHHLFAGGVVIDVVPVTVRDGSVPGRIRIRGAKQRRVLDGDPDRCRPMRQPRRHDARAAGQFANQFRALAGAPLAYLIIAQSAVRPDQFVEFVGVARTAAGRRSGGFAGDARHRVARQHLRQIFGAQHVLGHPPIHHHGAAAAIGALAVVQE